MRILLWVLVMLACGSLSERVSAETWNWGPGPKPVYLDICKTNDKADRDRDRICSKFIQSSYGDAALPEAALFLRERMSELIGNYEISARVAFRLYVLLVLIALTLAVAGVVMMWRHGDSTRRIAVVAAFGVVVLATLGAFGFNVQFKAHFTAARKLTVEKDALDLALINAARVKGSVDAKSIDRATTEYRKIIAEHSALFGGALSPPAATIFLR